MLYTMLYLNINCFSRQCTQGTPCVMQAINTTRLNFQPTGKQSKILSLVIVFCFQSIRNYWQIRDYCLNFKMAKKTKDVQNQIIYISVKSSVQQSLLLHVIPLIFLSQDLYELLYYDASSLSGDNYLLKRIAFRCLF